MTTANNQGDNPQLTRYHLKHPCVLAVSFLLATLLSIKTLAADQPELVQSNANDDEPSSNAMVANLPPLSLARLPSITYPLDFETILLRPTPLPSIHHLKTDHYYLFKINNPIRGLITKLAVVKGNVRLDDIQLTQIDSSTEYRPGTLKEEMPLIAAGLRIHSHYTSHECIFWEANTSTSKVDYPAIPGRLEFFSYGGANPIYRIVNKQHQGFYGAMHECTIYKTEGMNNVIANAVNRMRANPDPKVAMQNYANTLLLLNHYAEHVLPLSISYPFKRSRKFGRAISEP